MFPVVVLLVQQLQNLEEIKILAGLSIEFASVINWSEGSGARSLFVNQIYPPAIDALVTGMVKAVWQIALPEALFLLQCD